MRDRLLQPLLLALIPALLFVILFHPAILDPGNAGWLIRGSDNGENALGLHAYLHDAKSGWSLWTGLLNAPEGTYLLFTDSNPLVASLAKPFAPWLPDDAQFVGPWFLLCCILQAGFAWALLRRHAPDFPALWCGVALLCLLPTWFNRYLHANLFAHWLILWALWTFADPRRSGRTRWWAGPMLAAAMIHNYLLFLVAAIWGSAVIERLFTDRGGRARIATLAGAGALLLAVGIIIRLHGVNGGAFMHTGGYGAFSMPLDALWNPANPGYQTILPAVVQNLGRGYEGFQYLGLGLLLLMAVGFVTARALPPSEDERSLKARLRWLVPAFAVLTVIAISNFPDFAGRPVGRFPLPGFLAPLFDTVRASGRLFWPVAYTLVFVSILAVYRRGPGRAAFALAILIAIQLADTARMIAVVRLQTAEAETGKLYVRTRDPRWDELIASARDVAFTPGDPNFDRALFQEVAWRANTSGTPMRLAYTARVAKQTQERLDAEDRAFAAGRIDPQRLYVMLPGAYLPAQLEHKVVMIDGTRIIPPAGFASKPRR